MLFGRRKPGYTTTVDGAADPEQVVLDLQKAGMAAKKKPKAEVFSLDAASETARRLIETGSTFDGSAAKAGEDVMAVVVQPGLRKRIIRLLSILVVLRCRKVMRRQNVRYSVCSAVRKSAVLLRNVMTLVRVEYPLRSVSWQMV